MRSIIRLAFVLLFALLFNACKNENMNTEAEVNIPPIKTGTFYKTELNSDNSVIIADTIIYDVIIRNTIEEDDWQEFCLKNMDRAALTNIIFNAIYNGKLTAYDYQQETPMTIEEVKQLEKEYSRDLIGKMQFVEEWYLDEKNMQMGKRVNEIMLAYEIYNLDGEVRAYKAGVKVYLTDKSKNPNQSN